MNKRCLQLGVVLLSFQAAAALFAYPLDGYEETGIRRLQFIEPASLPAGARLPAAAVLPSGMAVTSLPAPDPALSRQLRDALGEEASLYSVAVLDVSDPDNPRFMVHNPDMVANIGSVGKLIVLMALFDKLAALYPDDTAARKRLLRETRVTADNWAVPNSHVVPIVGENGQLERRRLREGDSGSLYEFLDWMLSASSNAAATMVIQQVILLEQFGHAYRGTTEEARAFLKTSSPGQLGRLWLTAMERPLKSAGFDTSRFRQGSPFTSTATKYVNGTNSVGNTTDLIKLLNLIEAGHLVDEWSSLEAKRLLYMTARRIRYASHPVLNNSAVYFKSGSLYSCQPEEGFVCRQYMGNRLNRLASIAIVESPADEPALRYLVAVMSNVLRVNSAVAHQTLALRVHRLIEASHGLAPASGPEPVAPTDAIKLAE